MDTQNGYTFLLGWMLVKPVRQEWMSPRVPQPLLSASRCLAEVRPESDDWYGDRSLADFVVEHQRNVEGNFIFLDTVESARAMNARWLGGGYLPVGLALRPAVAERFDDHLLGMMRASNRNNPAYRDDPLEAMPFAGAERILGYEVLSYNWGWCSYLCGSLEDTLLDDYGGQLNEHGLITDGDVAERFAADCAKNGWGEPGFFFACALYGNS